MFFFSTHIKMSDARENLKMKIDKMIELDLLENKINRTNRTKIKKVKKITRKGSEGLDTK